MDKLACRQVQYIIIFMLILIHVSISVLSLCLAAKNLLRPNKLTLALSYSLIALTILSGALIAVGQNIHLVQICSVSIAYTVIVSYLTVTGSKKLASLELED